MSNASKKSIIEYKFTKIAYTNLLLSVIQLVSRAFMGFFFYLQFGQMPISFDIFYVGILFDEWPEIRFLISKHKKILNNYV